MINFHYILRCKVLSKPLAKLVRVKRAKRNYSYYSGVAPFVLNKEDAFAEKAGHYDGTRKRVALKLARENGLGNYRLSWTDRREFLVKVTEFGEECGSFSVFEDAQCQMPSWGLT